MALYTTAGERNKRIKIENYVIVTDLEGFQHPAWETFHECWARVVNINGKEFFAAQTTNLQASTKFNISYVPGITTDMRIIYKGIEHNIIYVDNIREANRDIEILCKDKK